MKMKMVINFDFRNEAKKSGHLDVAKLWPNIFQYISIYFSKSWLTLDDIKVHEKPKLFREGYALDYSWPSKSMQ